MPLTVSVTVHGQRQAAAQFGKISAAVRQAIVKQVAKSALNVQRGARRRAPVDTGRLRASIRPVFYRDGIAADVGSDVEYAHFMEFGTGPLGASTNKQPLPASYKHGGRYFPPPSALEGWARRHSGKGKKKGKKAVNPFAVAHAIFKRGGTPARPYLFPAWEEERPRFVRAMKRLVKVSARKAKKRR
jgi:hypothetical protein